MRRDTSRSLFREAKKFIAGGVNSPVRAFGAVGGGPLFIKRGKGSKIYDADGNEYIDYVGSWGPLILGHSHPKVLSAIRKASAGGTTFGAPSELETKLAKIIIKNFPSIEKLRFVSSGTEAAMSAIRLARGYTKRDKIIKFEGCYHGHADPLLVRAGSGAATFGISTSLGVNGNVTKDTLVLQYNDIAAFKNTIRKYARDTACVIVEPIAGNMGVVLPKKGFLEALREETKKHDIVLIFDEVITGFRVSKGGAQKLYGIKPDLTVLGKIIGGGLPVGAFGGRRGIMAFLSPEGGVYQAGTLSGNPIAMAAGVAALGLLNGSVYKKLDGLSSSLEEGFLEAARRSCQDIRINRSGSMLTIFFTKGEVLDYKTAKRCDVNRFARFHRGMLERGIYLPPSQFEAFFVSLAHTKEDIEKTIKAVAWAFSRI